MGAPRVSESSKELPCIRCGDCLPACPVGLDPQQLHVRLRAGHDDIAARLRLSDCTSCAACDAACPSDIPLAEQFRIARHSLDARALLLQQAKAARERFEQRAWRLKRDSEERRQRELELTRQTDSSDAVAAALARAKARLRPGSAE